MSTHTTHHGLGRVHGWMSRGACAMIAGVVLAGVGGVTSGCDEKGSSAANGPQTRGGGGGSMSNDPATALHNSKNAAQSLQSAIENQQANTAAAADNAMGGAREGSLEVDGLVFNVPSEWKRENPTSSMHAADYTIAGPKGAASVVFFTHIGGSAEQNVQRWEGQVKEQEGLDHTPEVATNTYQGIKVTTLKISGQYQGMGTPLLMGARFLGAQVDGPRGPVQIRITGPAETVEGIEKQFDAMVAGVQEK